MIFLGAFSVTVSRNLIRRSLLKSNCAFSKTPYVPHSRELPDELEIFQTEQGTINFGCIRRQLCQKHVDRNRILRGQQIPYFFFDSFELRLAPGRRLCNQRQKDLL